MMKNGLARRMGFWVLAMLMTATSPVWAQEISAASGVVEMSIGNPDAQVEVIEYASLTCPHCAAFHRDVFPKLKAGYIDTGKIHFTLREVYLDRAGLFASITARCGGQDKFFPMVERILATQNEWSRLDSQPAIVQRLRSIALSMGVTDDAFRACFYDEAKAELLVDAEDKNRREYGITSTPTFVINGRTYSNMSYDEFAGVLDAALSDQEG